MTANEYIRIGSTAYVKVKTFKYLGYLVTNQNSIQKEIKCRQSRNSFKYHVSCTDGNISVRIVLFTYFSTFVPLTSWVFFPVGLSSLTRQLPKPGD